MLFGRKKKVRDTKNLQKALKWGAQNDVLRREVDEKGKTVLRAAASGAKTKGKTAKPAK